MKEKQKAVEAFLNFASKNRKIEKDYKFNREECYDFRLSSIKRI